MHLDNFALTVTPHTDLELYNVEVDWEKIKIWVKLNHLSVVSQLAAA